VGCFDDAEKGGCRRCVVMIDFCSNPKALSVHEWTRIFILKEMGAHPNEEPARFPEFIADND
jgi:hypothetical protein